MKLSAIRKHYINFETSKMIDLQLLIPVFLPTPTPQVMEPLPDTLRIENFALPSVGTVMSAGVARQGAPARLK